MPRATVRHRAAQRRHPRRRSGFVPITTAITLTGLLALIGLGTDVGRIYVARSEQQAFADEAALAASFELDGTITGIQRASAVAAAGPGTGTAVNHWNFGTQTVQNAVIQFATAPQGPFDIAPSTGSPVSGGSPPVNGGSPLAPELSVANISVAWTTDATGLPLTIIVSVVNYTVHPVFQSLSWSGKPSVTVRFAGRHLT